MSKDELKIMPVLHLEPLTPESFAPFGDVIQTQGSDWFPINNGTTQRYHKLALAEVHGEDVQVGMSIFRGDAFQLPMSVNMLERHPHGSQAFVPINQVPYIVVVAPRNPDHAAPDESKIRAFYAAGNQGVNYHRGTWHHPLLSLNAVGEYLVVDRIGKGHNCDECDLSVGYQVLDLIPSV